MELSRRTLEELAELKVIDTEDVDGEKDKGFINNILIYAQDCLDDFSPEVRAELQTKYNQTLYSKDATCLEDLKEQLEEIVYKIKILINGLGDRRIKDRAKAYWLPHIEMAISDDHGYLGKNMGTIADTIEELRRNL